MCFGENLDKMEVVHLSKITILLIVKFIVD